MSGPVYKAPSLYVSITIGGEIEHSLVTAAMNVAPSHTAIRGRSRWPGGPPAKSTYWLWRTEVVEAYDAGPSFQSALRLLEESAASLSRLRQQYDLSIMLRVNVTIEPRYETAPAMYWTNDQLDRLARLGVNLECDVTLLAAE